MTKPIILLSFLLTYSFNLFAERPDNSVSIYLNYLEFEEVAFGLMYIKDFSERDRFFISGEFADVTDVSFIDNPEFYGNAYQDASLLEFEFGYLRRITEPNNNIGFFVGPSIAYQSTDGNYEGFFYDNNGNPYWNPEWDVESNSVNAYLNVMLEVLSQSGLITYMHFAYGYSFSHDVTFTGVKPYSESYTETADSNTFWNLAFGFGFAF
jgi:hypothetical protein